ncbi:MAG: tetratricopeptide repeat protein [Salinivirgaceae bacterium]|nr:tetratricopeptide repeat protein [Salinivirgaceae bacterium]
MYCLKLSITAIICFTFNFNITEAFCQNSTKLDSLLFSLERTTHDTMRIDLMNEISESYRKENSQKAEDYVLKAMQLSEKIGFKRGLADSYKLIGTQSIHKNDYSKATEYLEKAIGIYKELGIYLEISVCYRRIGLTHVYQSNFSTAIEYYNKALIIDEQLDNMKGVADCFNDMGVIYNYMGDHTKSIEYQQKSLEVCKQLNDKQAISSRLINLGASYDDQSDYTRAIECYMEALNIKVELNDKRGISMCYNNIGEVCNDKGDYALAIGYYEKSLSIDTELDDKEGISISLINIGNIHSKQQSVNTALEYYEKSLKIAEQIGNKRIVANNLNNIGESLIALGEVQKAKVTFGQSIKLSTEIAEKSEITRSIVGMGEVFMSLHNYLGAIGEYKKASELHKELGEKGKMATDAIKIGNAWMALGNSSRAIESCLEGLKIAQETGSKENVRMASEILSKAYAQQNQFQKAYQYSVIFKQVHDSIFTIESKKQINLVENRFEIERNKQEIELQNTKLEKQEAEIKQQQIKQNALVGIVVGMILGAVLIIIGYLRIKKAKNIISHQMIQIEETNEELKQINEELKVTLEDNTIQKRQIEKKNKEITDSINYATYIQKAILPNEEKLKKLLPKHFVFSKPKNIISGDFYWTTEIKQQTILAVADCTGHGVPGAFMSMLGISLLNEIINKEGVSSVDEVLKRVRTEVIKALNQESKIGEQREGMDLGICSLDFNAMKLQFAGANTPLYIIRHNDIEPIEGTDRINLQDYSLYEIKGDKMPVALYGKMGNFRKTEINIFKGDYIYMFSDGFADQFGGVEKKRLQYKPFKELLLANCEKPMEKQKVVLQEAFKSWQQDYEQIDDVLVMGVLI